MILIIGRSCAFSHNCDVVVFTRISRVLYITSLPSSYFYFTLKTNVLLLYSLDLIVSPCDGKLMLFLDLSHGLLMAISLVIYCVYRLVSQPLSTIWKNHVKAMFPRVICFWLLTRKQQIIYSPLIQVQIAFFENLAVSPNSSALHTFFCMDWGLVMDNHGLQPNSIKSKSRDIYLQKQNSNQYWYMDNPFGEDDYFIWVYHVTLLAI